MKYFIANWKAHKTIFQAVDWMQQFTKALYSSPALEALKANEFTIIICPPFPFISDLKNNTLKIPNLFIGAQDVSMFHEGSHTGEVTASSLNGLVEYVIVGHSERRADCNEDELIIASKVEQLQQNKLKPIQCIRGGQDTICALAALVAFEPVDAIGTGKNMNVAQVVEMKKKCALQPGQSFIYGGSVTPEDCREYLESPEIEGFLVGTASLDPHEFLNIIQTAVR